MTRESIAQNQRGINRKVKFHSEHSTLCALSRVICEKRLFEPIHESVHIAQKTVKYRPTDKLVFIALGILAGSETVYDLNQILRVDHPLFRAFGYEQCADQSVIQQTLNAATSENVEQLESVLKSMFKRNSLTVPLLESASNELVTIDIDLSGQPASKNAEGSTKGYFPGKKNSYGRQLARVLADDAQEIVTESLYPGNTSSCSVFKEMIGKMEQVLPSGSKAQRSRIRLRFDAGFGTDENINFALWRDYHLLAKVYSGKRSKALAKSVCQWVEAPSAKSGSARQAGWVNKPHRYGRKTKQVAIRTPKKKGGYTYSVLVTTELETDLQSIVKDYDKRSGVPENSFCQDSQGLSNRKRRKRSFVAQQILTLLSQLAHNLIRWMQNWMINAVERAGPPNQNSHPNRQTTTLVVNTLKERGMKRFIRQILSLSGKVVMKGKRILRIILNPLYPLINRIKTAFKALLKPYNIKVSLGKI